MKDIVAFTPFHLETKGEYGKQASEVFAVLINKDKAAGISLFDANSQFKKAKFAYYAAYHDKKNAGLMVKIRLLLSKPVWCRRYESGGFWSGTERTSGSRNTGKMESLLWSCKNRGVPAYVVNGKYLIYTKSIKSIDSMADLIRELASK